MATQALAKKLTIKLICDLIALNCPALKRRPLKHSHQECVENILKVLTTGQQWSTLGHGYSTYQLPHKRFCQWSNQNIFSDAFYFLQKLPSFANSMGTSFFVDACVLRNKCGHDEISHCYKIKAKRSTKITIIVGTNGLPVSLCVAKSSQHDVKFVMPALAKIRFRKRKIRTLVGDKGYQQAQYRKDLKDVGINYLYHQRSNIKKPFVLTDREKTLLRQRS